MQQHEFNFWIPRDKILLAIEPDQQQLQPPPPSPQQQQQEQQHEGRPHHSIAQHDVIHHQNAVEGANDAHFLLAQNAYVKVRRGWYCAGSNTPVALISFKSGSKKDILWREMLHILGQIVFPNQHIGLAQTFGVSVMSQQSDHQEQPVGLSKGDCSPATHTIDEESQATPTGTTTCPRPVHVVMEYLPLSLFDLLHGPHAIKLTRHEIIDLALQILHVLSFLHQKEVMFGDLSSRKVMLDGHRVKLRGLGMHQLWVNAGVDKLKTNYWPSDNLPVTCSTSCSRASTSSSSSSSSSSSACGSHTGTPLSPSRSNQVTPASNLQRIDALGDGGDNVTTSWLMPGPALDLYAFGVLLLEMCSGEKPNREMMNHLTQAGQIDPLLEQIIRRCLFQKAPVFVTAQDLLRLLETRQLEAIGPAPPTPLPTVSIGWHQGCFVTWNRSLQHQSERRTQLAIEQFQQRMDLSNEIALKRLDASEKQLIQEQTLFDELLRAKQQVDRSNATLTTQNLALQSHMQQLQESLVMAQQDHQQVQWLLKQQIQRCDLLHQHNETLKQQLDHLQLAKTIETNSKLDFQSQLQQLEQTHQQLAERFDSLHACNTKLQSQLEDANALNLEMDARMTQAFHGWESQKRETQQILTQKKALRKQKLEQDQMLHAIADKQQQLELFPKLHQQKQDLEVILCLKDKELTHLHQTNARLAQELQQAQLSTQSQIQQLQEDNHKLLHQQQTLQQHQMHVEEQWHHQELELRQEIARLGHDICQKDLDMDQLKLDLAKAHGNGTIQRCLSGDCDAPAFLLRPSGFCEDCEKKNRKARKNWMRHKSGTMPRLGHPAAVGTTAATGTPDVHQHPGPHDSNSGVNTSRHSGRTSARSARSGHPAPQEINEIDTFLDELDTLDDATDSGLDSSRSVTPAATSRSSARSARAGTSRAQETTLLLKKFCQRVKENEPVKEALIECRVFGRVLELMASRKANLDVHVECCRFFSVAAFDSDRNRVQLVTDGAVQAILKSMKRFLREPRLHEVANVVFTNLAHNSDGNRKRIVSLGGLNAILNSMQLFPLHPGIQKRCCWALLTLAGSDELSETIASQGGIGGILAAMLNCASDESVQFYGCWALFNLLSGSPELQHFARQEGVVEVCEAAFACFVDHAGIQEKAHQVLELLQQCRPSS